MFFRGQILAPFLLVFALYTMLLAGPAGAQADPPEVEPIGPQIHHPGELLRDDEAIGVEGIYIVEQLSNVKGGIARGGRVLGNLNLLGDLDAEKAFGWKGGSFHAYLSAGQSRGIS